MAPLLRHSRFPGRARAGQVSLKAAGDVAVLVVLTLASLVILLLLMAGADAAWKLGGLAPLRVDAAPWMMVVLSLAGLALPLAWIARRWRYLGIATTSTPAKGAAIGVVAGLLAAGISYPFYWLGQWTGNDILPSNTAEVEQLLQGPWLVPVLVLVVIAPVTEEIVFRKFLLARFLKSGHVLPGIVLTSVFFGLMHEPFPAGEQTIAGWALLLVDYSLMGALFAAAYCSSGRLSAAILAHAISNLIVCAVYWISP